MKIIKIKKRGSIYKIYLDNKVLDVYDEVILKYNLLYKKSLDDDLISIIEKENKYYENYNKTLKLIDKRLRSEYEVKNFLEKEECPDSNKIIQKLKELNLINDYNFAKVYVNDKVNLSLDGPEKIRKNLEKLRVDTDIINEVIDNVDKQIFLSHIEKLISKKLKSTKYTGLVLKNKLTSYLINQGYSKSMINLSLENIDISNNIDEEMEKIYKKLSLKYKDNNLKLKLKQKLFSKGFSVHKINSFIEEKGI